MARQMSSSPISFTVRKSEPELVVPSMPTPRELKQLSDIDELEVLRIQCRSILFYKDDQGISMKCKDPAVVIKEALGRALVHYYPLAGRLVEGRNGKLSVDCTGEGVLFTEASADISLRQLGDSILSPQQYLDEVLHNVPGSDNILGCPIIRVQVTRLLCGGFVLGLRANHAVFDAIGLAQFLMAVAEIARGADVPSILPVWQRELLNARDPPRITCEHHEYLEYEEKVVSFVPDDKDDVLQRSFVISPDFIKEIRKDLPEHLANCTSFELLTGCLWKCVTLALNLEHEEPVYVSIAVNARAKRYNANIPLGYYGNAITAPTSVSTSKRLCEEPLAYAVELVKAAKNKMSAEYIRSLADFKVMGARPRAEKSKGFFDVSDIRFFGDFDFGWGLPVYAAPIFNLSRLCHFTKYKNIKGQESIVVVISLPCPVMNRFEQELKKMKAIIHLDL